MINQQDQEAAVTDKDIKRDPLSRPQSILSNDIASASKAEGQNSELNIATENDKKIRDGLELLNQLAAKINLLEKKFDESNITFRNALKQSTDRLKMISQTLGIQSIKKGRQYLAAKLSAEQIQIECQDACVQFEQANNFHSDAKEAIRLAEVKLKCAASVLITGNTPTNEKISNIDAKSHMDQSARHSRTGNKLTNIKSNNNNDIIEDNQNTIKSESTIDKTMNSTPIDDATKCSIYNLHSENLNVSSEEMNQAIQRLLEAEKLKGESQLRHQDKTKKMLIAQNHVSKLEREFSNSIRKSKPYFEEANRFNARLNSIKAEIDLISREIVSTKKKYAATLNDLESLSEEIHAERRYNHLLDPSSSECDSGLGSACDGFLNGISDDIMNIDLVSRIDIDQNNRVLYSVTESCDHNHERRAARSTPNNNDKPNIHDARQSVSPPLDASVNEKLTRYNENLIRGDSIDTNDKSQITSLGSSKKTIDCINNLLIATSIHKVN